MPRAAHHSDLTDYSFSALVSLRRRRAMWAPHPPKDGAAVMIADVIPSIEWYFPDNHNTISGLAHAVA